MLSNYIYENMKEELLKGFTDSKEKQEILYYYKKYLDRIYDDAVDDEEEFEEFKDKFLNLEKSKWKDTPAGIKQGMLVEDEYLNKLGKLSDLGFRCAKDKLEGKQVDLTEDMVKKYLEDMKLYASKVRDFNSIVASNMLSEATVDFEFASNQTNNMSLRIGRIR